MRHIVFSASVSLNLYRSDTGAPAWSSKVTCVMHQHTFGVIKKSQRNMTYRPIVDKSNFHHGLKFAVLDSILYVEVLYLLDKVVIQPACFFGVCCAMEVGLGALFGLCQQSKLGYWLSHKLFIFLSL